VNKWASEAQKNIMTGFNVAFRMARDLLVASNIANHPPAPIGLLIAAQRLEFNCQDHLCEEPGAVRREQE
jgi:hypothetical protein